VSAIPIHKHASGSYCLWSGFLFTLNAIRDDATHIDRMYSLENKLYCIVSLMEYMKTVSVNFRTFVPSYTI